MKNFKLKFAALTLTVVMTFGAVVTNAGIVVQGLNDDTNTPVCTEPTDTKVDWGIVVQGIGIVVQGLTGIVVQGATSDTPTNCGIVVQG